MLKKTKYPFTVNPKWKNSDLRWIENVSKGWRLVGFADEINRMDHRGWFTDDYCQSEVMRGVVYQLPTRKNGDLVFAVGYADPNNDDCAALEIIVGYEKEDAARQADTIAEIHAEKERDYQTAWRLGTEFYDLTESIQAEKETRRDILREVRMLSGLMSETAPTLCRELKGRMAMLRASIRAAYDRKAEIIRDLYTSQTKAFLDGAQMTSAEFDAIK